MSSGMKPTPDKKSKAVPSANPFGLSTRDSEIMIYAWKCLEEVGKIDKELLAKLTNIPLPDSAARSFRRIMAIIRDFKVEPTNGPGTPGNAPTTGNKNGSEKVTITTATAAAVDPSSPSVVASDKKKKKQQNNNTASGPTSAGRKRTKKEADAEHSGDEGDKKNDSDGEERPRKMPRFSPVGKPIAAQAKRQSSEALSEDLQAAEA